MTRLFGFSYNYMNKHVIGIGRRCICFNVYLARVPRRRLKGWCYITTPDHVVFHLKHNSGGKFRFFGYVSIDEKDLMDE